MKNKSIPDIDPHFSESGYQVNQEIFKKYDPVLMGQRSLCPYDIKKQQFLIEVLGDKYVVSYPSGEIYSQKGEAVDNYSVKMIILRYLMNADGNSPTGEWLSFKEFPDGPLYYANFYKRCIKIFSLIGTELPESLEAFIKARAAQRFDKGDISFSIEVMPGVKVLFILWHGDDEFEPEGQILFDRNLTSVFSIKDLAVLGDVLMLDLKTFTAS